ncbi:hypothetical protein MNQ98_13400 [Paenibacillus sp. N3/727]|uniref:hypothetical protein n=1 Tax=Paenibacillus sp. N3/727 TaxID=2925845 RepID=UPI001F5383EF|nr:hypothetical protein [Paenibacillus sp. N3/727]UNK20946.1 hypothetical protein MNQ98_13400 [Paenibacillus sp. N3/727]
MYEIVLRQDEMSEIEMYLQKSIFRTCLSEEMTETSKKIISSILREPDTHIREGTLKNL